MKALFYLEPFGLRDAFVEYKGAMELVLPMLRALNMPYSDTNSPTVPEEARLLCSPALGEDILTRAPNCWPLLVQPTHAERGALARLARPWAPEGEAQWIAMMRDPQSAGARVTRDMLTRIHGDTFAFDTLVCWGENAGLRAAAAALGVPVIFLELASFRAPFPTCLAMDPGGVNGGAASAALDIGALARHLRPLDRAARLAVLSKAAGLPPQTLSALIAHPLPQALQAENTALVALQLSDDANQLLYSAHSDAAAVLEAAVPPLLEAGYHVQIKPHPGALARGGEVWARQTAALSRWRDGGDRGPYGGRVQILPDIIQPEQGLALLEQAAVVVSNNSSVSFEALLLDRPAVTLGQACFAPPGALPDLATWLRIRHDAEARAPWRDRGALVATAMLACSFPPAAAGPQALRARRAAWAADKSLLQSLDELAWQGWPGAEDLRARTLIRQAAS